MPSESELSVGSFFEEIDDDGVLHYYWVLAVAKVSGKDCQIAAFPLGLDVDVGTTTDERKRISWDVPPVAIADPMRAVG
jgi:hypothetical protein